MLLTVIGARYSRETVASNIRAFIQAVQLVEEVRELGGRRYNKLYILHIDNITANYIREKTSGAVANRPLR